MSLGSALHIAQNSLASVSRRTDVVARNVANANDGNYVRRDAHSISGSQRVGSSVSRAALDGGLVRSGLEAGSEKGARDTIADGLASLSVNLHGPDGQRAPVAALSRLHDALQTWGASPADDLLADAARSAATGLARSFEAADTALSNASTDVEGRIRDDIARLNRTLAEFGSANEEIVRANRTGQSVPLDALDRRDAATREIAELLPIAQVRRRDGDVMLTTARGATLFETEARTVSFDAGSASAISIDGVAVPVSGDAEQPRGRLEAHMHLRNVVIADTKAANDAMAQATIAAFAGSGLFSGSTAADIRVPAGYDMETLRGAEPSFSDDIIAATESAGALLRTSPDAIATLAQRSSEASAAASRSGRIVEVLEQKRLAVGGVDVDAEMTQLLALERSYEASARIIAVADRMLADLLAAVR